MIAARCHQQSSPRSDVQGVGYILPDLIGVPYNVTPPPPIGTPVKPLTFATSFVGGKGRDFKFWE